MRCRENASADRSDQRNHPPARSRHPIGVPAPTARPPARCAEVRHGERTLARVDTGRDVAAIVLSYVGIGLVFGHDVMTQKGNVLLGSAWVLLSALLYATYLLGSGRLVHRVGTLRFASYAGLVSCVAVVTHYAVTRDVHVIFAQPAAVYGYGILMAVVSTVLPIVLTSEGIKRLGASHASIIGAVGPVATIFLGAAFLDEAITVLQLAGAALVLAGVLAISLGKKS